MRREARLSAAIDILDIVVKEARADGHTVTQVMRYYFADKRYAGSGDRRAIGDSVFSVLRNIVFLEWSLNEAGGEVSGRNLMIAEICHQKADIQLVFGAGRYGPDPLSDDERGLMWFLPNIDEAPEWVQLNCPEWMLEPLKKRFGRFYAKEIKALDDRAPFIGRVNALKTTSTEVAVALTKSDITCRISSRTPNCIFMSSASVKELEIYKQGHIEVQDQSGQIASLLVAAKPGHKVLDMCAGAGGKSLAIAVAMKNEGEIIATDINPKRIYELDIRSNRAGVNIIRSGTISKDEPFYRDRVLVPLKDRQDRVVLDVPCSGSGTWRRSPELRLRMTQERVEPIVAQQKGLMNEGAECVKLGGRLIYMTCSLLPIENEEQISWFLKFRNTGSEKWRLVPYKQAWLDAGILTEPRDSISYLEGCLQLSPMRHESDGFFVAVLERQA